MENIAYLAAIKRPIDIELQKFEITLSAQVLDVRHAAGEQIVHSDHRVFFGQQGLAKMGTQKSSPARDQRARSHGRKLFGERGSTVIGGIGSGLDEGRPTL